MSETTVRQRQLDRVHKVQRLGADGQVDDKALVIPPNDFALVDPFLLMAEDWFSAPGFEWHPHRGIETVTLVVDGALEHGDNRGGSGVLAPGDVQWMTAGSGIVHRELAYRDEHVHSLQLWVNLPAARKMADARYQDLRADTLTRVTEPGVTVSVVSGQYGGARGPAANHWPITGLVLTVEPGSTATVPLPGADRAFSYVMSGRVFVGARREPVRGGEVGWSDPTGAGDSVLAFQAPDGDEVVRVVLFSGAPIREPVVAAGPFVMNSGKQIARAYEDFYNGRFGPVPRLARLSTR